MDKMNAFNDFFYDYEENGNFGFNDEQVIVTHLDPNLSDAQISALRNTFVKADHVAPGGVSNDPAIESLINMRIREDTVRFF